MRPMRRAHPSVMVSLLAGAAAGGVPTLATGTARAQELVGYVIEDSGFFGAPGVTPGRLAAVDLADPGAVTLLRVADPRLRWGGLDFRRDCETTPVGFENLTNALREVAFYADGAVLIDSVGWHEAGVSGLAFSNDGSIAYTCSAVSGFGRVVEADARTGAVRAVHNILGPSLSSLAVVPEGHPTLPAGQVWGMYLTGFGSLRLAQLDLDNDVIAVERAVAGIGFNPQFETGLDFAPDGTLYACIQGFREVSPDVFEEISSHLYTLDPATGQATDLGVIQGDATWDAASLAVRTEIPAGCSRADLSPDGLLDFFDLSAFLARFGAADPIADFNCDGLFDFFDVSAFLSALGAGCG